eukprot:gene3952-4323_t
MGCASSDLQNQLLAQQQNLHDLQQKSHEQQNLLRFKVEVLVNMLAVEEKKNEVHNKRIDTLKWLLYSQGVNEETLTRIVSQLETTDNQDGSDVRSSREKKQILQAAKLIDLAGAMDRMRVDFESRKEEIIRCLATEEGKIAPSLAADEFMQQVYSVTEHVSKADLQVIALRFEDGFGYVVIPDFLDFFSTPQDVRAARLAANAVRMSLDLLELDIDIAETEAMFQEELEGEAGVNDNGRGNAMGGGGLDRGAKRLLSMWEVVKEDLQRNFETFRDREGSDQQQGQLLVSKDVFMRTLEEIGGKHSSVLHLAAVEKKIILANTSATNSASLGEKNQNKKEDNVAPKSKPVTTSSSGENPAKQDIDTTPIQVDPLDHSDIDLLTERFELNGLVHYGHFLAFFEELYGRLATTRKSHSFQHLPTHLLGTSPFRQSVDWVAIRQESMRRSLDTSKTFKAPRQVEAPPTAKPAGQVPVIAPNPNPKAAEKTTPEENKNDAKPHQGNTKDEKESKDVPPPPPQRNLLSYFMCGTGSQSKPTTAPQPLAQAKDSDSADKDQNKADKQNDDRSAEEKPQDRNRSFSVDSQGSESSLTIKKDYEFTTPKIKTKSRRVQLPPDDNSAQDVLQLRREGLGNADKPRPTAQASGAASAGSRFRRRIVEEDIHDSSSSSAGQKTEQDNEGSSRFVRSRLDDEEDEEDDSFAAVSKVRSNVKGRTASAGFQPRK